MIVGIVCDESILQANFVKIFEFRIKISSSSLARFTFFFFQVFNMYTFYYISLLHTVELKCKRLTIMVPVNPYLKKKSNLPAPVDKEKLQVVTPAQSRIQGNSTASGANAKAPTLDVCNVKMNRNAIRMESSIQQTSTMVAKHSITPSPTMKIPLKEQLKYEIALLKKQKKERLLAKQLEKNQAIPRELSDKNDQIRSEEGVNPALNRNVPMKAQFIPITDNKRLNQSQSICVSISNPNSIQKSHVSKIETFASSDKRAHHVHQSSQFAPVNNIALPVYVPRPTLAQAYPYPITTHHSNGAMIPIMRYPFGYAPLHYQVNHLPQKVHVPPLSKAPPCMPLHTNPLDSSCFGKTHSLLQNKIVILKKEGDSFGINLKYEAKNVAKSSQTCGVLMVTNASTQNMRAQPGTSQADLLQKGDIIISVNSVQTLGLEFREAIALFAKIQREEITTTTEGVSTVHDYQYRCVLTVARDKKRSKVLSLLGDLSLDTSKSLSIKGTLGPNVPKVPLVINPSDGQIVADTDLNSTEVHALLTELLEYEGDICEEVFSNIFLKPALIKSLRQRTISDCSKKWNYMVANIESEMFGKAISHWKSIWKVQCSDEEQTHSQREYIADSERSYLRQRPRPIGECKCGSKDHQYVDHPSCFLYRNIRKLINSSNELIGGERVNESAEKIAKYESLLKNKTLNSIGNAHLQRVMSQLEEQEAEKNEASFVNKMEILQVKNGVAVFAPKHKVVMLLSSIAAYQESGIGLSTTTEKSAEKTDELKPESDDDSDDEDDIPLTAILGKRSLPKGAYDSSAKRPKCDRGKISFESLVFILKHVSHTWGHLYQELSPIENAW